MNIEKKVQSLQANCILSGASQDCPVIVGWSTAPRGQVIEESLGQLPKKLAAARACWQGPKHHAPIRDETGWTTPRSPGEVGTNSVHSNPVCLCGGALFSMRIYRAAIEKKEAGGVGEMADCSCDAAWSAAVSEKPALPQCNSNGRIDLSKRT